MEVFLNAQEIAELDKQDPTDEGGGGFQSLLVRFQNRVDRPTGRLVLTARDIERVQMYAFKYGKGSWENWLRSAFERTLGPTLGGKF